MHWHLPTEKSPWKDHLKKLNDISHLAYERTKATIRQSLGKEIPVILHKGDDLVLMNQNQRKIVSYVPEEYHILKNIAHLALGIHNICGLEEMDDLADIYRETLQMLSRAFRSSTLPEDLQKYRPVVLGAEQLFLNPTAEKVNSYFRAILPLVKEAINDASQVRIYALHNAVKNWRVELSEQEWGHTAIIIMGPHMPRKGELSMQYANCIMGKQERGSPKEGCPYARAKGHKEDPMHREQICIYAEGLEDEDKALDLLITHIVDERVGSHILEDPKAMHQDILADATSLLCMKNGAKWRLDMT